MRIKVPKESDLNHLVNDVGKIKEKTGWTSDCPTINLLEQVKAEMDKLIRRDSKIMILSRDC